MFECVLKRVFFLLSMDLLYKHSNINKGFEQKCYQILWGVSHSHAAMLTDCHSMWRRGGVLPFPGGGELGDENVCLHLKLRVKSLQKQTGSQIIQLKPSVSNINISLVITLYLFTNFVYQICQLGIVYRAVIAISYHTE